MLLALYGLEEVERIDRLVERLEQNDAAFDMQHAVAAAQGAKTHRLADTRQEILREMSRPATPNAEKADSDTLALQSAFPGMPNYRATPRRDRPTNVVIGRRPRTKPQT